MAKKTIYSSDVSRAVDTARIVQTEMEKYGTEVSMYIKDMFGFNNGDFYSKEIIEERLEIKKNSGKSENEFVKDFLDGQWKTKPTALAKPYLNKIGEIFDSVVKSGKKISIIAFRHGDKTIDGDLSDEGKMQSSELGKTLSTKDVKTDRVVYIATHNTINESIIRTLIANSHQELPSERIEPLDFTEIVEYTLLPGENGENAFLEIELRGLKKSFAYDVFKDIVNRL